METTKKEINEMKEESPLKVSKPALIFSFLLLAALIVLVVTYFGEVKDFALLFEKAKPWWLAVAIILQLGTYGSAGAVWEQVVISAGYHLRTRIFTRLAIEKFAIDQLVPAWGVTGNLAAMRVMRRFNLPVHIATEAFIVDILSRYTAFIFITLISAVILLSRHGITPVVSGLLGTFAVVVSLLLLATWWVIWHKDWHPPAWILKRKAIARLFDILSKVSLERIGSRKIFLVAVLFQLAIFFLDAGTLWVTLESVGITAALSTVLVAVVIGSIAAIISFIPGGIGSFETGCTATLVLLGIPIEGALAGTLLLRGFIFWLPIIPGYILAHHDAIFVRRKVADSLNKSQIN